MITIYCNNHDDFHDFFSHDNECNTITDLLYNETEPILTDSDKKILNQLTKLSIVVYPNKYQNKSPFDNKKSITLHEEIFKNLINLECLTIRHMNRNKSIDASSCGCRMSSLFSIGNIGNIKYLKNLESLTIMDGDTGNEISEIFDLPNLQKLTLNGNNIKNITGISNCKKLHYLDLSYNDIINQIDIIKIDIINQIDELNKLPGLHFVYEIYFFPKKRHRQ